MKALDARDKTRSVPLGEAVLNGVSDGGGLYVPSSFPRLSRALLDELTELSFVGRTAKLLSLYFDELSYSKLLSICKRALSRFDGDPCTMIKAEDGLYVAELWHGASASKADISMNVLAGVAEELLAGERALVVATDNIGEGRAALEAFSRDRFDIVALFCSERASGKFQLKNYPNAICVRGDENSVKRARKNIISDPRAEGMRVINVGNANILKVLCDVAVVVSAYCDLLSDGEIDYDEQVNFALAGGDLTLATACLYAYKMGLPIGRVILGYNVNRAFSEFLRTGIFDANTEFFRTSSPELDVLVPVNMERLLFEFSDRDSDVVNKIMEEFALSGRFEFMSDSDAFDLFESGWADEDDVKETLFNLFDIDDCVVDTHTAVAASVFNDYACDTEDMTNTVLFSTSGPYKYPVQTLAALGTKEPDPRKAALKLAAATALECPVWVEELANSDVNAVVTDEDSAADAAFCAMKKVR